MLGKVWLFFVYDGNINFSFIAKIILKATLKWHLNPSYPLTKSRWNENGHLETGSLNISNIVTKYWRKKWKLKCGNTIRYYPVYCGSCIHSLNWVNVCASINWRESVLGYITLLTEIIEEIGLYSIHKERDFMLTSLSLYSRKNVIFNM